ncbi:PaaI family thioesterase [Aquabacterium humicola]|uniref:PaaI family thioesterase n=1 Tax=Aquabacterium humicola TaxID=3237377 RepID=UPI002542CE4F|nr:PaaI family thioesterase [Rubrivivax pictus]
MNLERWQAIFDRAPFVKHLGVRIDAASPGELHTSLVVQPHHLQHTGFVHAGVITTLADHSAGAAAQSSLGDPLAGTDGDAGNPGRSGYVVTAELKVSLLRAAKGGRLRCVARVLKTGRQIVFTESEVWCDDGQREQLVAKLSGTMAVVPPA